MCVCQIFYSMGILEEIIGRLEREEELSAEKKKRGKAWIAVPVALSLSAVLGGAFAAIPVFICRVRYSDSNHRILDFLLETPKSTGNQEPDRLYFSKWNVHFYFSKLKWNKIIRTEWGTFNLMLLDDKTWEDVKKTVLESYQDQKNTHKLKIVQVFPYVVHRRILEEHKFAIAQALSKKLQLLGNDSNILCSLIFEFVQLYLIPVNEAKIRQNSQRNKQSKT